MILSYHIVKKFQEKKKWRDVVQSKPALILLGIVIVIFTWNVFGLMGRMEETSKNRKLEEAKITELQQREKQLMANISSLKTEKGVEDNIREKFGLAKDGEGMIVVVEDSNKDSTAEETSSKGFSSFFKKIFNLFNK